MTKLYVNPVASYSGVTEETESQNGPKEMEVASAKLHTARSLTPGLFTAVVCGFLISAPGSAVSRLIVDRRRSDAP